MFDIQAKEFDYKFTAGIGIVACVLSIVIGLVYGVSISSIIIRTLLITPVFLVIGYAVVYVLRKYVPEIYEAFSVKSDSAEVYKNDFKPEEKGVDFAFSDNVSQKSADEISDGAPAGKQNRTSADKDFSEIRDDSYPKFAHETEGDLHADSKGKSGKMGKHILKREELAQYEPKLMAEAVRTMMQKDDEK